MSARVGYVASPLFRQHRTVAGHPERPARLDAVDAALARGGLLDELDVVAPESVDLARVRAVHTTAYVERLVATAGRAPTSLDQDTHVCERSFEVALAASGGLLDACERVLDGAWSRAFCAVRPPGHHAEADRAMGFCLVNHVAVAARALREVHGLERVAIVDWDVHHGNGTQHLFEDDPTVFYASLHQWPLYPGTGAADERGVGDGEGATLNLPLPAGAEDATWLEAFEGRLLPALEAFRPEFVLVSAGFDAHRDDPLARTRLDEEAFVRMTEGLCELAEGLGHGRVVSVLEGGYDADALGRSAAAHVSALLARP